MTDKPFQRRIFWEQDDIPEGVKALVVKVRYPVVTLIADEAPDKKHNVFEELNAFIEITADEWSMVRDNTERANAMAKQFGHLVRDSLGGHWHRWHDPE